MESSSIWPENLPSNRIKAIQELTKGQILTNKLHEMLGRPEKIESDLELADSVVVQILGMFDNTLSILGCSNKPTSDSRSPSSWEDQKSEVSDESINTMKPAKTKRGCYKRRKNASTITKYTSTLIDDGYAWRKYGQKAILNSKHQRNYYRCSHKYEQKCQATKQVQKTNEESSKYKITYIGVHTCNNVQGGHHQIIAESPNPMDNSTLISFETNTLMGNNKVEYCFSSINRAKEGFCLGDIKHEQVSSSDYHTPWDSAVGLSEVPSEPMSVMSSGLDCEDMVSSRVFSSTCSARGFEIDDIQDFDDFLV